MSDMAATNGEDSSSNNNNGASRGNGRGRGGRKGRWAPLALTEENFAPVPTQPSRGRGSGHGRGSGRGGNASFDRKQNLQPQAAGPSTAGPSQVPRRHVIGMDPVPENASAPTAPSGPKNRRHRGQAKNANVGESQEKKKTSFMSLPFELRERIMLLAHDMTIAERPACRALVTNKPLNMAPEAIRARARPAPVTRLRNFKPREGLNSRQRKSYLWNNPGQWGPVFEVMYAGNRQLYEEAKQIRYREIRVEASISKHNPAQTDEILMNRLQFKSIQDHTKYAVVAILHKQQTVFVQRLVDALKKLQSLKHLCVVVRTCHPWFFDQWAAGNPGSDKDLLLFFGLKLETLTIAWDWADNNPFDLELEIMGPGDYISSPALEGQFNSQDKFINDTYKPSAWYKDFKEGKVQVGKIAKHLRNINCQSYGDKFFFQLPENLTYTYCPHWSIAPKNPHNHPDQAAPKWSGYRDPKESDWQPFAL